MSKRDIGKEILAGLDEIAAWKRGELKLKTTKAALPKAADVPAIRARLGLSQAAFARKLGVTRSYLCDLEKNRKTVSPAKAAKFARLLGYSEQQYVRLALQDALKRAGSCPALADDWAAVLDLCREQSRTH